MPVYSHSRLSCFESCPRRYYYQYVAKIAVEEEEGIEGFLGSLVHDALEKLYRDRTFGKVLPPEHLIGHFNAEWKKRYHDGIAIVRQEYTPEDYRRVGEECLRKYHARHAPFDQQTVLALEERVSFALDKAGRYQMVGFIDRLSQRPDGTCEIHDYKTNQRLPSQQDKDQDRQLALYQLGIQSRWGDVQQVELIWHFLRHDKDIRSSRSQAQLDQLREATISLIDRIEALSEEEDFETRESGLCDWCSFQHVCPVRKHCFQTEALPPNRFLEDSGVELVNRHRQLTDQVQRLKTQMAEIEAQRAEVEAALLAYAEREGVTLVVGSTHEARIVQADKVVLPRKTQEPEAYGQLDQRLREDEHWPVLSMMDTTKLRRIWKGDDPDPGQVRQLLTPFVSEQQGKAVRFRARASGDEG